MILAGSGISFPLSPSGWPWPSQCSSSARMASAVASENPSLQRDLGAAVTARRSSATGSRGPRCGSLAGARPGHQRSVGRHGLQRPHERRHRPRPVDQLRRPLRLLVVGAEQRRHVRRVRRAPGVLEQQRIEQVRSGARRRARARRPGACRSGTTARRAPAALPRRCRGRWTTRRSARTARSRGSRPSPESIGARRCETTGVAARTV